MANKNLEVTAVYVTENEPITATAVKEGVTGFQVISIDGPYDKPGGKKIDFVDKTKQYVYYITIDGDTSEVNRSEINWAVSYDGKDSRYIIKNVKGGRLDENRLWLYINSQFAENTFTVYAYTGTVPTKGSSITVSIDHAQYKANILKGDRCSVPSNTTIVTDEPTPTPDEEFELVEGLRLYFLRYGLFLGGGKSNHATKDNKSILNNRDGVSQYYGNFELEGFHCHATELNLGYVYIINPDKATPKDSFEYEILPQQKLFEIPWPSNEEAQNKKRTLPSSLQKQRNTPAPYHVVENHKDVKELYACFSPIQWSAAYYKKMCKDASLREKRMTLISCEPFSATVFEKEVNHSNIYSHLGFSAVFPEDNGIGYNRLVKRKERITKHYNNLSSEKVFDLFIPLHDPIGCAEDLAFYLEREIVYHRANVEAIRFGECIDDVAYRIINAKQKKSVTPEEQKISDMFDLALTSYQMVYNDQESIDDYDGGDIGWGGGIHKPKLLKILDVEGRKKQRQKIRDLQNDLGTYLKSSLFNHFTTDFYEGGDICNFAIKPVIARYLSILVLNPHDIDRALDLKKHQENDNSWESFIEECVSFTTPTTSIQKILDYQVDITSKFDKLASSFNIVIATKFADFINKLLESYSKIITKNAASSIEVLVNRLNASTVGGFKVFNLEAGAIKTQLPENVILDIATEDKVKYTGARDRIRVKQDANTVKLLNKKHGKNTFVVNTKVTTTEPTIARKILDHNAFKGSIAGLQVLNLSLAIKSYGESGSAKELTNLIGAVTELSEAVLNFKQINARVAAVQIARHNIGSIIVKVTPIASGGITVIMCGWEAYDSFNARDTDAALAFAGAGVMFAASSYGFIVGASSVLGPLGWICAGIAVGLLVLAYYLKDSPLEAYFKRYMFSDIIASPVNDSLPAWQYNVEFYNNREIVMGKDNAMMYLEDPTRASAELYDLIVCSNISFKQSNFIREEYYNSYIFGGLTFINYAATFTIEVSFRQFFRTTKQFEYELYYYEHGIKSGKSIPINSDFDIERIEGNDTTPPKAQVVINLSERLIKKANKNSCLLFICRLQEVQDGMNYPIVYDCIERYLGAIVSIQNKQTVTRKGSSGKRILFEENVRIAQKSELINGTAFK